MKISKPFVSSFHHHSPPEKLICFLLPLLVVLHCSHRYNNMRPEGNPLDLNNLPEEYGKQTVEESSTMTAASTETTRFKKKKGGKDDDGRKIYECRFCSLTFCKSQALGGHMNRHRQERETETLNRARQLVFSNDGLAVGGAHIGVTDPGFGESQSLPLGNFQYRGGIGDLCTLPFQTVYARTSPPLQPYMYPSTSTQPFPYPISFPPPHPSTVREYVIARTITPGGKQQPQLHCQNYNVDHSNGTCFGPPLTHSFPVEGARLPAAREGAPSNQVDGNNWSSS